jgi:hypothetical protein
MSEATGDSDLEREFDVFASRAGLAIPPDRRRQLFEGFIDLHRMLRLLRQPREASAATADAYSIETIVRTL